MVDKEVDDELDKKVDKEVDDEMDKEVDKEVDDELDSANTPVAAISQDQKAGRTLFHPPAAVNWSGGRRWWRKHLGAKTVNA